MDTKDRTSLNKPRCPVCNDPLKLWATVSDEVRAECPQCGWGWRG